MKKLSLNENFICRIWEDKTCYSDLSTTLDELVEIMEYGKRNYDAGPDYKDARIKIGNVTYTGSIEIHRSLDDWYLHNHEGDNKYNDLILHVVFYGEDTFEEKINKIKVKRSRNIPTVILSGFLKESIHSIWKKIIENPSPEFNLPCFPKNKTVSPVIVTEWLSSLSSSRMVYKSDRIHNRLREITGNLSLKIFWEQVLFEFICEALGFSKNKEQFLRLAKRIEPEKIKKLCLNQNETDSIVFGLSGFLCGVRFKDSYVKDLKNNWSIHKDILQKEIMDRSEWQFFRLRPVNFPTQRLAYASALLSEILYKDLFKCIIKIFEESEEITKALQRKFMQIEISEYWRSHYDFGKEKKSPLRTIGQERIKDIITNVLLPFVYTYSVIFEKRNLKTRIENFYKKEKQKSGSNEVTRIMENQINVKIRSLADEQALMHLHNFYCIKGKCNECEIGKTVFANDEVHEPLRIILY